MKPKPITIKWNDQYEEITPDEIAKLVVNNKKISLIKIYRGITGAGLKDSKDAIEKVFYSQENAVQPMIDMLYEKAGLIVNPYTKEEFLFLVEDMIDNMDKFHFPNMLEAVITGLNNIKEKGGLDQLAKDRDHFLNRL